MNAWSLYRRAPGLLTGVTVLLSCFLLSSCNYAVRTKTLFGEHRDQFPAIVLSADTEHETDYVFDWKKTTVGGVSAIKFIPSKDFYRLHFFRFSDGARIGSTGNDYYPLDPETCKPITFTKLPTHELLRADLEFADDEKGNKGQETYSFMVLFHYEKNLDARHHGK